MFTPIVLLVALVGAPLSKPTAPTLTAANIANARTLVSKMSLDEKVAQAHGYHKAGVNRETMGLPNLGIPDFNFTNGPAGLGPGGPGHGGPATALSSPLSLAATWDRQAAEQYGRVSGTEALDYGNSMIEAPDINIARQPQGGRTFEAYGEDPYLVGQLAVADIEGIQSVGEIANVKHYVANNQETNRTSINEIIDDRALREIYLPAFEAAIREGDAGSVMGAYDKVNGTFCCENSLLLDQILRREWNFQGFVTCDFGAMHSTVNSALAGLDYESEGDTWYGAPLEAAISSGQLSESVLDTMLTRRFAEMDRFGQIAHPPTVIPVDQAADGAIDRRIAAEGMVLLKNDGALLPMNPTRLKSVALIGPLALLASTGGGGSSEVKPAYRVSPLDGLAKALGASVMVNLDDGSDPGRAAEMAKRCDMAIVMVGNRDSEGSDQKTLELSQDQDDLVDAVAAANPKTVVVLKTGSAVLMPWLGKVSSVLEAWYPGEEDGNAVADVLTGAVDPSGKLPLTFPSAESDTTAADPAAFPGINGVAHYSESIFVGYRGYDQNNIQPLFPFGYGLSYTSFKFSDLIISGTPSPSGNVKVSFTVTNTGERQGAEVAQLYVGIPSTAALPEPPRQLKGFERLTLQPHSSEAVTLSLNARGFAYWDTTSSHWAVNAGTYTISVGDSSRTLPLTRNISVKSSFAVPDSICP